MKYSDINEVCKIVFQKIPEKITRKTIGICNEVYEVEFKEVNYILRMNKEKKYLYGTHKFLPIFKKLQVKTPQILAEDYSKKQFPFCYQFLSKIKGKDLGVVIDGINERNLKKIAKSVSNILDKFNALPPKKSFGLVTGVDEESYNSLVQVIENQKKIILERNEKTKVIDKETIDVLNKLLSRYQHYFQEVIPKLYYDDLCSKNVMIHHGKFSGLVDLDFLVKGDYLEAVGRIMASWDGEKYGEIYIREIIKLQNLNNSKQKIVKLYALINLIYWTSEEGIKFNSNSTGIVNWDRVKKRKEQILNLYNEIIA